MPRFPRASYSTQFARRLRREMTEEERLLWWRLTGKEWRLKWRRQEPIGPYIVDFLCYSRRLIVELDGSQHIENRYDLLRDAWLEKQGFRVLRFSNYDVNTRVEIVLDTIETAAQATSTRNLPFPSPSGKSPRVKRGG